MPLNSEGPGVEVAVHRSEALGHHTADIGVTTQALGTTFAAVFGCAVLGHRWRLTRLWPAMTLDVRLVLLPILVQPSYSDAESWRAFLFLATTLPQPPSDACTCSSQALIVSSLDRRAHRRLVPATARVILRLRRALRLNLSDLENYRCI